LFDLEDPFAFDASTILGHVGSHDFLPNSSIHHVPKFLMDGSSPFFPFSRIWVIPGFVEVLRFIIVVLKDQSHFQTSQQSAEGQIRCFISRVIISGFFPSGSLVLLWGSV
jgi:hypothetical protein